MFFVLLICKDNVYDMLSSCSRTFTIRFSVSLNEKESDKCMMELMGYQTSKKKCGVSEHCINIMTRKGLTGYGITHQLLWTMLSEQVSGNNCLK